MDKPDQLPRVHRSNRQETDSDSTRADRTPLFEIDLIVLGHRIQFVPNVHAVLAFSAMFVAAAIIYSEMIAHGRATPLELAEVAHFAGWIYLEIPEAIVIEELGEEELERYGIE